MKIRPFIYASICLASAFALMAANIGDVETIDGAQRNKIQAAIDGATNGLGGGASAANVYLASNNLFTALNTFSGLTTNTGRMVWQTPDSVTNQINGRLNVTNNMSIAQGAVLSVGTNGVGSSAFSIFVNTIPGGIGLQDTGTSTANLQFGNTAVSECQMQLDRADNPFGIWLNCLGTVAGNGNIVLRTQTNGYVYVSSRNTIVGSWGATELSVSNAFSVVNNSQLTGGVTIGASTNATQIILVKSATASLDFPSISTLSFADLNINVAGAHTNDIVNLGRPANETNGLITTAFVSSNDFVTVRANNYTATPINQGAATYRVEVIGYSLTP